MTEAELRAMLAIHDAHTNEYEGGQLVRRGTADGMCSLCFAAEGLVEAVRGTLQALDALRSELRRIHDGRT